MLERKFAESLEKFLLHEPRKILLVNGARQIGKSYLIRYVEKTFFRCAVIFPIFRQPLCHRCKVTRNHGTN